MIRRPPRSTQSRSSAASDVYKRQVGLREARLGAEAAVLRAAARLGVDQRAHVGGIAEVLDPRLPGPVDEHLDLGVIGGLAQLQCFLVGDERRQARPSGSKWT